MWKSVSGSYFDIIPNDAVVQFSFRQWKAMIWLSKDLLFGRSDSTTNLSIVIMIIMCSVTSFLFLVYLLTFIFGCCYLHRMKDMRAWIKIFISDLSDISKPYDSRWLYINFGHLLPYLFELLSKVISIVLAFYFISMKCSVKLRMFFWVMLRNLHAA